MSRKVDIQKIIDDSVVMKKRRDDELEKNPNFIYNPYGLDMWICPYCYTIEDGYEDFPIPMNEINHAMNCIWFRSKGLNK